MPVPGEELFAAARQQLGELPLIVEDLGLITRDVEELRDRLGYPGMKVLHFAFDSDADNPFLPHNYHPNFVVYTGTHDNDTTRGWWEKVDGAAATYMRRYTRSDGSDVVWDLIRLAMASVADLAVAPLQDVLDLGSEARMNTPAVLGGNWAWRFLPGQLTQAHADRLRELAETYGRLGADD
jgi:4-alpha-glucanotransferase